MNRFRNTLQFLRIYGALILFDLELRRFGFSEVFRRYLKRHPSDLEKWRACDPSQLNMQVPHLLSMIDRACALYPFEAQCLHRSFLGYRFVRDRYGIPLDLVVGVKKFPFRAHAWLMFQGGNVNEATDYTEQFLVILHSNEGVA